MQECFPKFILKAAKLGRGFWCQWKYVLGVEKAFSWQTMFPCLWADDTYMFLIPSVRDVFSASESRKAVTAFTHWLVYESAISLQIYIAGILYYAQTSESGCPKKDIGS